MAEKSTNLYEIIEAKNNKIVQYDSIITQKENELKIIQSERLMLLGEVRVLNEIISSLTQPQVHQPETVKIPEPVPQVEEAETKE